MCQIRDISTHKPLPGITVGDIGPKLGYQTKDNGFLAFDNYKVPRLSLLAKYNRVDDKGVFSKHGNEKVTIIIYCRSHMPQ
jgi:acyl-CoA oxidase